MSLYSDVDLCRALLSERITIDPFRSENVGPCSVDVRLSNILLLFENSGNQQLLDPKVEPVMHRVVMDTHGWVLLPGQFALGSTEETVTLDDSVAARFEGKSSIGRLGLLTHVTAGFIDAGFTGQVTVELCNVSGLPLKIYPGMKIGQLCFFDLLTSTNRPYSRSRHHYQGQTGPTPSRAHLQFGVA